MKIKDLDRNNVGSLDQEEEVKKEPFQIRHMLSNTIHIMANNKYYKDARKILFKHSVSIQEMFSYIFYILAQDATKAQMLLDEVKEYRKSDVKKSLQETGIAEIPTKKIGANELYNILENVSPLSNLFDGEGDVIRNTSKKKI